MKNELILLFDLDDTIILEEQSAQDALLKTVRIVLSQHPVDPENFVLTVLKKARSLWHSMPTYPYCLDIGISSWEGLWGNFTGDDPGLKKLNALKVDYQFNSWNNALLEYDIKSPQLAQELSVTFNKERRKLHNWFPEAEGVLQMLQKNYAMGLITNGAPDIQREKIKGCHVGQYFDLILVSGEVGIAKPKREIFDMAIRFFKKESSSCIMIGNSLKSDICGAKNAGITSVWINRENIELTGDSHPDYQIQSLTEIPSLLARHSGIHSG